MAAGKYWHSYGEIISVTASGAAAVAYYDIVANQRCGVALFLSPIKHISYHARRRPYQPRARSYVPLAHLRALTSLSPSLNIAPHTQLYNAPLRLRHARLFALPLLLRHVPQQC